MTQPKFLLSILFVCALIVVNGQTRNQTTLGSYIPVSQAYTMYYPLDFQLSETEDGIVSISDSVSGLNITVSSFMLAKKPKDVDLIVLLNSFLNDTYNTEHTAENWNVYTTKFDNFVELKTHFDDSNWVWYGISEKKTVIILSLNKDSEIGLDDLLLARIMLETMIIQ